MGRWCALVPLIAALLAGCAQDEPESVDDSAFSMRGMRYCEILLVYPGPAGTDAEVWGTQGLNDCPAESWEALEPNAIQSDNDALAVKMNGPRFWLPDGSNGATFPDNENRMFGDLEMRLLASVQIDAGASEGTAYVERVVERTTSYVWFEGAEIYELTDPHGAVYVMQAYAQIVDSTLSEEDLPSLGGRLELPQGWTYEVTVLEGDLELVADGQAIVVQDELENTYQRHGAMTLLRRGQRAA